MTQLEYEMLKQRICVYENIIYDEILYQNYKNFMEIKEELFQDLLKAFKGLI
jgi:hypothetical protein